MKRIVAITLLLLAGFVLTLAYLGQLEWEQSFLWVTGVALLLGLGAGVSLSRREPQNAIYILLATGMLIALLYTNNLTLLELSWDASYRNAIGGGLLVGILSGALL